MKKIITAIGNETLNSRLKNEKNIQVILNDIQYKEGIFEILEQYKDIDIIIINNLLQGNISTTDLVQRALKTDQRLKIIIILEKENKELETFLYKKGVYKIIYDNQIELEDLIKIINNENETNADLKEEIRLLKNIILENQQKKNKSNKCDKFKNIIKNKMKNITNRKVTNFIFQKNVDYEKNKKTKVITITGPTGVGKSIISVNLAKANIYSNNKILIIDLNVYNNSIHTILGVKKNPEKRIKINKKIDLITSNDFNYIKQIENIKLHYDVIIIDLSSFNCKEFIEHVISFSDINIFVSDTNLLEINKSIKLLEIIINKYKINKNKFNILFNKYNSNSIDINVLNNIFAEFNIIGYLEYSENYNKLINKNSKNFIKNKKLRNEYIKLNNLIKKKVRN